MKLLKITIKYNYQFNIFINLLIRDKKIGNDTMMIFIFIWNFNVLNDFFSWFWWINKTTWSKAVYKTSFDSIINIIILCSIDIIWLGKNNTNHILLYDWHHCHFIFDLQCFFLEAIPWDRFQKICYEMFSKFPLNMES